MAKIILVASGKGGAGKSTVSALLGEALAFSESKVLLLELDSGLRSLDVALGVTENILFDMGDIIRGSCDIQDAVVKSPFCPKLSLIAAAAKSVAVTENTIRQILSELDKQYDFIILDCPAGIGGELENAAKCSDLALVVATPDPSSVRGARTTGALISDFSIKEKRLVIERCPRKAKELSPFKNLDEMIDGSELQLIAVIWEDPAIRVSMDSGKPLDRSDINFETFRDLSERVRGKYIPLGFK